MSREILSVETTIVDIPMRRAHVFSATTGNEQSFVLVRIRDDSGVVGIGEGVTPPGGPWWSGESVDSIKLVIDKWFAPILIGQDAGRIGDIRSRMDSVVEANRFAKSAIEMALWDGLGKAANLPLVDLLGGARRTSLPVRWALSGAGSDAELTEEIEEWLERGHAGFKLKAGAGSPEEDVRRATHVVDQLADRGTLVVDPNGSWDEVTAMSCCRQLAEIGVTHIEQPVARWNLDALARISQQIPAISLADESVQTSHDGLDLIRRGWTGQIALKWQKAGGLLEMTRLAAVAESAGIKCYAGAAIEGILGSAAALHVMCALPNTADDGELLGPLLLTDDIAAGGLAYQGGSVHLPSGPGIGIEIDEEKVEKLARDRADEHAALDG